MRLKPFATQIEAFLPGTDNIATFAGPIIYAATWDDAVLYCEFNGLGYCEVIGELVLHEDFNICLN